MQAFLLSPAEGKKTMNHHECDGGGGGGGAGAVVGQALFLIGWLPILGNPNLACKVKAFLDQQPRSHEIIDKEVHI